MTKRKNHYCNCEICQRRCYKKKEKKQKTKPKIKKDIFKHLRKKYINAVDELYGKDDNYFKKKLKFIYKNRNKTLSNNKTNCNFIQIRSRLLEERGNICENCKRTIKNTKFLHLHHKNRNRSNNSDNNLIFLCATCHLEEHIDSPFASKLLYQCSQEMELLLF